MLSEEEKKAIERINNLICGFRRKENKQSKFKKDLWCYFKYRDYEATEILLHLIDQYQKEIEEWRNGIRINDKVSIPKDKIKAKIEENQEKLNNTNGFVFQQEYMMKIKILNELLEELNKWDMI